MLVVCNAVDMQANAQNQNILAKKPSTGSSKVGAVLSVVSLIVSAIGYGLIHANYKTKEPLTTTSQKVGDTVAAGTAHVYSSLIGVPFITLGIFLGLLAILFTVIRLRKVKTGGLVFSVIWVLIAIWAIRLAIVSFQVIRAHPA